MTRRNSLRRLLTPLLALALVAAACGNDDDEDEAATDDNTADDHGDVADAEGDGVLRIGTLLPETGSLAFLGPSEFAGVDLAVQEINEAGGVLGRDVHVVDGDSGDTSTDIANQTTDRLLAEDVDVIIGATSPGVSFTVIDKITGAGVVQISPANTSPEFTDYDDNDLYFRTAPSDVLQGRILGELINEEGHSNVGILALQDPYGESMADSVEESITDGGGKVAEKIIYDPQAQTFDAEVRKIKAAGSDAVVVIGFHESARIISTLAEQGVDPKDVPLYLVDGNTGNALGEQLPAGLLEGVKGTIPGAEATQAFRDRLLQIDPELEDYGYAAESYDAVIISGLATIAGENDAGTSIGEHLVDVTKNGLKCTTFKECADLLAEGEDIDYDGVSGPIEFSDKGDPTEASVGIYTFGPDNKLSAEVEYRSGKI